MLPYRLYSLYSGSTGNAMLLTTDHARILIDAGKNAKTLCRALETVAVLPSELDAILITHDHRDHTAALPVFLKRYPVPVHAVEASAQVMAMDMDDAARRCLCRHTPLFSVSIGNVHASSFITPHDSRFSVGYRIRIEADDGIHEIGYATDIGYVTSDVREGLLGCESVVLESNHDREMLLTGPYPRQLKERIFSRYGHLANDDSAAFAAELAENGLQNLMLAHLSEQNNDPRTAYDEAVMALGGETRVCISVAAPDHVVELRCHAARDSEVTLC